MKALSLLHTSARASLVLVVLLWSMTGVVSAGLFEDEEARRAILDLRQQLETLKRDSDKKIADESRRSSEETAQFRRSLIELQNQLETLRADLAKLRGQDEQIAQDVAELQRRQKDAVQAADDRLRKLEPMRVSLDGRDFLADPSEKREFEAGMAIFRRGDFANAQVAFVDFLNRYVQSGYRASALFWLGNAQYATKDYKEAMVNFRALLTQAPDHMRVPETMLAIANCQLELKDNKAAKKSLEEVVSKFPASEAGVAAKDRLTRLK